MARDLPKDWKVRRKAAIQRDSRRCRFCNIRQGMNGINLEVHHIVPRRRGGGTHNLRNLITLCQTCHNRIHYGDLTSPTDELSYINRIKESLASLRWRKAGLKDIKQVNPVSVAQKVGSTIPKLELVKRHVGARSRIPDIQPRTFPDFMKDVETHNKTETEDCSAD